MPWIVQRLKNWRLFFEPLNVCLRGDRLSAIEQFDLPFEKAMVNEFKHGLASIAKEAAEGAGRFAKGAGRHGYFEKPDA